MQIAHTQTHIEQYGQIILINCRTLKHTARQMKVAAAVFSFSFRASTQSPASIGCIHRQKSQKYHRRVI